MNEVKLYINNQLIEFQTSPDILFTYQEDDLTNPTIVKNSYTKTITIPGTKQNNIIFDNIWNVERIQTDENFNVTKRVPFTLFINGDIYQTGYVKLDRVTKQNNKYEYSITLYGGLGSFLYNLSIDWNTGDKKTLADLDYYRYQGSSESIDLGFTINKDTVASAWTEINSTDKWGVVNFAPTYIGHPDKISCDKVLINFKDAPLNSGATSGATVFTPSQGYALGTLPQELTSEEVRDYRSYIQTPVIRVKSIFEALCEKSNNKGRYDDGYEVELDRDFFTPSNPYYWDSWVTLPTITNLEFSNEGGGGGETTAYTGTYFIETLKTPYEETTTLIFPLDEAITGGNFSVRMTFDLAVTGNTSADNLYMYYYKRVGRDSRVYYRKGYGLQLYASNSLSANENVLAGSNVKWISGEERYTYTDAVSSRQFTPKWNTNTVENHTGRFTKVSGSTYHFSGGLLELYCDLPIGTKYFKLVIGRCNSANNEERAYLTTDTSYYEMQNIETSLKPFNSKEIELGTIDSGESISNRYISKEMLLATSYSPADFLLSYCKRFGLYINKDAVENKIYIRTRNNYYKRDEVVNIENDIDYSKQFLINPVYCENGYLSLTDEGVESKSEKDYTQKTGKVYGQKIINTGYEFNADTKELNDKPIFKGSIQTKDVSQYYARPSSLSLQPYVYNGLKYNLYANGDFSASTFEYSQPVNEISDVCQPFNEEYPNYDYIGKPIFTDGEGKSLDTENVLLFFNGYESVPSSFKWYLTDDLAYMYKLNNNPTWLLTVSEYDLMGNKIANEITRFPKFGRWLEGNRWMIYSWDYGSPRMLYVPDFTNNDEGNIYHNYFKKYYEDLYDVDTKAIDTYMLGDFNEDDMRKFYWFRNSIWRLNKITDFNPTNHDTTKVQFIKVQDLNNMTNEDATSSLSLWITLNQYYLPQSGGSLIGTVTTSDNYGWTIENYTIYPTGDTAYTVTIDPQSYGSSGNFFLTGTTNNGQDIVVTINVTAGDIGGSISYLQVGNISSFFCPTDELWFTAKNEIKVVELTNPLGCAWEVISKPSWILTTPKGENTGDTLYIRAFENYEGGERHGTVVVWDKYHDATYTIYINQKANPYLRLIPNYIEVSENGGEDTVDVESNIDWTAETRTHIKSTLDTPLTLEIVSGGTIVWSPITIVYMEGVPEFPYLEYSINGGTWFAFSNYTTSTLNVSSGDLVQFRSNTTLSWKGNWANTFSGSTAYFNLYGNIWSITENGTHPSKESAYNTLFDGTNVVDSTNLLP